MKKGIMSLMLASALVLSLAACGKSGSGTATESKKESSSEGATESTGGGSDEVSGLSAAAAAAALVVNPNLGKGFYGGTREANTINVDINTMSVMNTIKMTYNTEFSVARHCWDALLKLDADNSLIPAAAESWESSEDGLRWTFHIRPGMKWVDSTGAQAGDVTAHDFVFAWSELLNPDNAAEYSAFATVFKNAQAYYDYVSGVEGAAEVTLEEVGFKAVDDYTLELELETYLPYLLQYLKFEVMSPIYQPFYEKVGAEKYGTSPDTLLFNGAFYMSNWITENTITVEKNASWYDAANVSLEKINFVKYTDANTRYNAFVGGELDITIDINGAQRELFAQEGFDVSSYTGGYSFYYWVSTKDTTDMRSVNLRKAVSAALNRQQLIDTVFKNDNIPSPSFALGISGVNTNTFSEAVVAANGGQPLYNPSADAEAAKEYLAAALEELGYSDKSEIKLSLMTSESTNNVLLSQVVQEQLRQVLGLEVGIEILTITEWRARRNAKEFDLCLGGWGPDYNDPMTDLELFTTTNGNNHTSYSNPEYDALVEKAKHETDPVAREKLFIECEKLIAEDLPIIPVYWKQEDYVVSEKIAGGYLRKPFQTYNLIYTTLVD